MLIIPLIKFIQADPSLRRASRLFYWLKAQHLDSEVITRSDLLAMTKESKHFSRYQIEKFLKTLTLLNWVGADKSGRIYLRGRSHIARMYGLPKNSQAVSIPPEALESDAAWSAFLAAGTMTTIVRSLERTRQESQGRGLTKPANDTSETPVSLECVMNHTSLSKSSASRLRKAAGKFLTVRQEFEAVKVNERHVKGGRSAAAMFREHVAGVISRGGYLYKQLPSLVSSLPTKRLRTRGGVDMKKIYQLINSSNRQLFVAMSMSI